MSRFYLFLLGSFCSLLVVACDSTTQEQQEVVVIEAEPPVVDSLQLQLDTYQLQLDSARLNTDKALRQLERLDMQLQDSIKGTQVPPQLQEETINTYQNKLHDVRQMQTALRRWQQQERSLPDTLTNLQRKDQLKIQLHQVEQLLQESWLIRQQSREVMLESDRDDY